MVPATPVAVAPQAVVAPRAAAAGCSPAAPLPTDRGRARACRGSGGPCRSRRRWSKQCRDRAERAQLFRHRQAQHGRVGSRCRRRTGYRRQQDRAGRCLGCRNDPLIFPAAARACRHAGGQARNCHSSPSGDPSPGGDPCPGGAIAKENRRPRRSLRLRLDRPQPPARSRPARRGAQQEAQQGSNASSTAAAQKPAAAVPAAAVPAAAAQLPCQPLPCQPLPCQPLPCQPLPCQPLLCQPLPLPPLLLLHPQRQQPRSAGLPKDAARPAAPATQSRCRLLAASLPLWRLLPNRRPLPRLRRRSLRWSAVPQSLRWPNQRPPRLSRVSWARRFVAAAESGPVAAASPRSLRSRLQQFSPKPVPAEKPVAEKPAPVARVRSVGGRPNGGGRPAGCRPVVAAPVVCRPAAVPEPIPEPINSGRLGEPISATAASAPVLSEPPPSSESPDAAEGDEVPGPAPRIALALDERWGDAVAGGGARAGGGGCRSRRHLEALCRGARSRARFTCVFTIHGEVAFGRVALEDSWLDRQQVGRVSVPLDRPSVFRQAAKARQQHVGTLGDPAVTNDPLRALGRRPPARAVLPILLRGRPVALLYLDDDGRELPEALATELARC